MTSTPRGSRRSPMMMLALAAIVIAVAVVVFLPRNGTPGEPLPGVPGAPLQPVEQVRAYPHDTLAFTQGLEFHGGRLYESTGRYGESGVREVELETGGVMRRVDLAHHHFGEGLTILDGRVYQLTWQDGIGYIYDLETFAPAGTFEYRGEGWGLANDGRHLIMSDGSNQLRYLDPRTFAVVRVVEVRDGTLPVHRLNELEWVHGEIWANVWHSEHVARIDPRSGRVIAWLDLSGLIPAHQRPEDPEAVLNGIAWDREQDRLFVTGKLWPYVYEIRVPALLGREDGAAAADGQGS
jgi:glutaminyl-peptide cyclotransferase